MQEERYKILIPQYFLLKCINCFEIWNGGINWCTKYDYIPKQHLALFLKKISNIEIFHQNT